MPEKLKIAFLGGLFPKEMEQEINQKSKMYMQNAANVLQWNIVKGLDYFAEEPVTILNSLFIGAYPKLYKDLFIKKGIFCHSNTEGHIDYQLPFLNFPLVKHLSRARSYKKYIRKHILRDSFDAVVGYSMTSSVVEGLLYAKKKNPSIKTCLIVPDLPEYMNMDKQPLPLKWIKSCNSGSLYKKIQKIDSFVVLTEPMADALGISSKPYVVVEGVVVPQDIRYRGENPVKNIVYTGTLQGKYGIKALVDAFHKLEQEDIRLVLCGNGDTVDYIKELAKTDSRICYKGIVPHKDIREIQESAYLLINPRDSREEYTKYSFPSKTMEYMDAGRPVLMYPLVGMPQDYYPHVFLIDPNEEDAMLRAMERVLALQREVLDQKGKAAKDFVVNQKNDRCQGKKIYDLLNA